MSLTPFFGKNLLVRVKLCYIPNFNFLGKPLLGEKYVEGKKEERRRRKNNNAKFSGHYVYPRTETVRAHALRSHQFYVDNMSQIVSFRAGGTRVSYFKRSLLEQNFTDVSAQQYPMLQT